MPNILDDIIASVVENKIPASRQPIAPKVAVKQEPVAPGKNNHPAPAAPVAEEAKTDRKRSVAVGSEQLEELSSQYPDISHCWLNNKRLLWLKDHRNQNNWKLFRECWKKGQVGTVGGSSTTEDVASASVGSSRLTLLCLCSRCWCRGSISD